MGDLTEHFSLHEFFTSHNFPDLALKMKEDFISLSTVQQEPVKIKCFYLCKMFLEPIRGLFKEPITISSGIRSQELNKLVNGSENSDHLFLDECAACDFHMDKIEDVAKSILESKTFIPFGQFIWYPNAKTIHLSLASRKHLYEKYVSQDGILTRSHD